MSKRYEIVMSPSIQELPLKINYMIDYYKHVEILGPPLFDSKSQQWCQAVVITE